jgi:hypothetical protein
LVEDVQRISPPKRFISDKERICEDEIFFGKITRFLGTSENAVRIQIAVALIAFLLLRLAQAGRR